MPQSGQRVLQWPPRKPKYFFRSAYWGKGPTGPPFFPKGPFKGGGAMKEVVTPTCGADAGQQIGFYLDHLFHRLSSEKRDERSELIL